MDENPCDTEYTLKALEALDIDLTRWRGWRERPWACMDGEERARVRAWLAANPTYQLARAAYADETGRRKAALAGVFPLLGANVSTRLALAGITPDTIADVSDENLRAIKGVGPKTLRLIRALYRAE